MDNREISRLSSNRVSEVSVRRSFTIVRFACFCKVNQKQEIYIHALYLKPETTLGRFFPYSKQLSLVAMVTSQILLFLPYSKLHTVVAIVALGKDYM
jgi:hypothetical protein